MRFDLTEYLAPLMPHERADLIAALRRDIESERTKAAFNPQWEAHHLRNVRLSVRLLEAFGASEDDFARRDRDNP